MECTDVSADVNTQGVVLVGQANPSIFEVCDTTGDFDPDTDWHEVSLEYGRTYLFFLEFDGIAPTIQPELSFFDRLGTEWLEYDTSGRLHVRYTARYTGRHYVSAFQATLLNKTDYTISAFEIKDDTKGNGPTIGLFDGFAKLDEIELVGDTDTFNFEVVAGRDYNFVVVGQGGGFTLNSPTLELSRNGSTIATGTNVVSFQADVQETLQVTVGGNAGTGTYQVVGLVADDAGQDANTTSELIFDENHMATKQGYVSHVFDYDWHKVQLQAGDIVKITLQASGVDYLATPNLIFRGPALEVIHAQGVRTPSDDAALEYYYEAQETGSHYVVARTKIDAYNGGYEVALEKVRTPAEANYLFGRGQTTRLLLDDNASIPLASLLGLNGLDPFAYQVYSSVPLNRDGVTMSPNNTYGVIAGNLGLWSVDESRISQSGDLLVRAVVTGDWSPWQKFAVTPALVPAGLVSNSKWEGNDPITYRFVMSRPSEYGVNEFGQFVPVNEFVGLGIAITDVFEQFNRITDQEIVAAPLGEQADINIFAVTDLGQPFLSYLPSAGRGGDMIFNQADFLTGEMTDLRQFRMLRALGTSLGLNFTGQSRSDSVMGNQNHPKSLTAVDFGWADWLALQQQYGSVLRDPTDVLPDFTNFVLNSDRTLSTVGFEGRNIVVGLEVADEDFTIDLRDGARSFARDDNVITSEVVVGYGAQVFSGVGGDGDDVLFGNGLANVLQGGAGDDFLTGNENNDTMIGGPGNDTLIHNFGDGHDLVSDVSGQDTLCFLGRGPFRVDDLATDYLFSRDGSFLDISLTLDGGLEEGSVRIDTGFNSNNLIESLELWHNGQLSQRISLFNLWNGIADGQTSRFTLAAGSDNFGRLVTPIT